MTNEAELKIVLLYALHYCGGRASKARATQIIMDYRLIRLREGDEKVVETRETSIENRIAWVRENLKREGEIAEPRKRGVWELTEQGRKHIEQVAVKSLQLDAREAETGIKIGWERFTPEFLQRLKEMGSCLQQQQTGLPAQ